MINNKTLQKNPDISLNDLYGQITFKGASSSYNSFLSALLWSVPIYVWDKTHLQKLDIQNEGKKKKKL